MGLSKSGYVKIEGGTRKLSDRHIRAAMKAFGVTEREILDDKADKDEPSPSTPSLSRDLSSAEAQAFAKACVMFLEENAGENVALEWIEALIEVVRGRGSEEDLGNLDILRAKVRSVSKLAQAGLLVRNQKAS